MNKCKCCENKITGNAQLVYKNMPSRAQHLLNQEELSKDQGIDLEIFQCPYCGLMQLFAKPVEYYRDVIRAVAFSEEMREFRISYFRNFIDVCHLRGKKVLEIGAGCGEYMEMLTAQDVNLFGIEHLQTSVDIATSKGLHVFQEFVETPNTKITGAPYDGFYIMNFLEHIPNPKEFLCGIFNNINEGAYGLVEVPNGNYILENHMFSEFMLDHLMYFSENTLRLMLELCGFEVLSCKVIWHEYILSAIVKKKSLNDYTEFICCQDEVINSIASFVDEMECENRKIAVWGAGHQALAILALADFSSKITCIIDSAEFKQNKFTPVSHIPIYGKEKIDELGIEAVIIMAGSYSYEIKKLLNSNYQNIKTLVIS